MKLNEGKTYVVLESTEYYTKHEKIIILKHDLTDETYWILVDDYAPCWEEAEVLENLRLDLVHKEER